MRSSKITDLQVLKACESDNRKTIGTALPDYLRSTTNLTLRVCFKVIESCASKGLLDCSAGINFPNLTEKGIKLLEGEK